MGLGIPSFVSDNVFDDFIEEFIRGSQNLYIVKLIDPLILICEPSIVLKN